MKNRFLRIVPIVALIFCFAVLGGCSKTPDLYGLGVQATMQMEELVKSDFYAELYLIDSLNSQRNTLIASDYDTPVKVYSIELPEKTTLLFKLEELDEDKWLSLPESVKEQILNNTSVQTLATHLNAENGTNMLAVTSNYIITKQINNCALEKEISYLYTFETGKPVIVIFSPCNNGIRLVAQFMITDKANSLSSLREVFDPFGCEVNVVK